MNLGKYVVVDYLSCPKHPKGTGKRSASGRQALGTIVEVVKAVSDHGPCCAAVEGSHADVVKEHYRSRGRPVQEVCTLWSNLRPLIDPDEENEETENADSDHQHHAA